MNSGTVTLVGAGPGAADLITLRALRVLRQADVILYDRLANPEIMEYAGPEAERIYVGKSKGEDAEARQQRIHLLMIGHARQGKHVVRLKGGDPFVFGRGGEELMVLAEAGIEATVVPGISSSIAAPMAAGIPVTYRGVAASFGVFAARPGETMVRSDLDWSAAASLDTAVFLMGVERLGDIVSELLARGRQADTPVAVIERAHREDQRTTIGTLADIEQRAREARPPATIIVGDVVRIPAAIAAAATMADQYALAVG